MMPRLTNVALILIVALFVIVFANQAFFRNVVAIYPLHTENGFFLLSLAIVALSALVAFFSLVCFPRTTKPVLITVLLLASVAAYFMDTYNVIIDDAMLENAMRTDPREAADLLSPGMLWYVLMLGVVPALWVLRVEIRPQAVRRVVLGNLALLLGALGLSAALMFSQSAFFTSFIREHKPLRLYLNPLYPINSAFRYAAGAFHEQHTQVDPLATDAAIDEADNDRELIIFVVGETARADHFSLNGYERETNPRLRGQGVISFTHVSSCGTSTAHSVPCMFSIYPREDFSKDKANNTENLLDVLQRAGVNVIWLDNNSSSKGVAKRVPYLDFRSSEINPVCDVECRDEGMLSHLRGYIDSHPVGDIFIVLHQMGNHGPAYYKRYPKAFERFSPVCTTNQLEECSSEAIRNAYDNALLYTDHFLAQTIDLLKEYPEFESALLYVSDHGESLGENNLYLHGMPYLFAPKEQTRVPMILWANERLQHEVDLPAARADRANPMSHDNLFHTVLGLLEIQSEVYDASRDILKRSSE